MYFGSLEIRIVESQDIDQINFCYFTYHKNQIYFV